MSRFIRVLRNRLLGAPLLLVLAGAVALGVQAQERQRPSIEALETKTHELVNEHRRSKGLPPLAYSRPIAAIARRHSEAMAEGRISFSHEGFETRRRRIARSIPLEGIAENVGVNTEAARRTVSVIVSGWLGSSGHRENIEGDYDATGIGIARSPRGPWYFTQIFVKRRRGP